MSQDLLFRPFDLAGLALPNRIVMAPMTRNRADRAAVPSPMAVEYYASRAAAGLLVTEATQVTQAGQGYARTPAIGSDAQVAAWRTVTDAVHEAGGRIFLQVWHTGRISHRVMQPGGALPVAPSAIAAPGKIFTWEGLKDFEAPRALETAELPGIVEYFVTGARRAIEAGFDGVEVHAANGYLLEQFLDDGTNHRTDAYGGSIANRARLVLEVVEAVAAAIGRERVGVRVSPGGTFNGMHDSDPAALHGYLATELGRLGIAYLHVIEPMQPITVDGAPVSAVRHLRERFPGALIAAGGFTRESAEEALRAGSADLVAFGKPFLANPDLPARFALRAPLNTPDPSTFYTGDAKGYIDYPTLEAGVTA